MDADAFTTRWPIKHVVFLIKENRTFDHLFGTFPGARGVRVGRDDGVRRPPTPLLSAFDFDREPRPAEPLPLRADREGPVFFEP